MQDAFAGSRKWRFSSQTGLIHLSLCADFSHVSFLSIVEKSPQEYPAGSLAGYHTVRFLTKSVAIVTVYFLVFHDCLLFGTELFLHICFQPEGDLNFQLFAD